MKLRWRKVAKGGEARRAPGRLHHHPFLGWRVVAVAVAIIEAPGWEMAKFPQHSRARAYSTTA
jgi:hypothetical protein